MRGNRTYFPTGSQKEIKWYLLDADGRTLGRLATEIAKILRGKHKPTFTPHADSGFRVAVVNAENVQITGNKAEQKVYFRHSGYPGGDKYRTFNEQMERNPKVVLRHAVKGMLPKNRLGRKLLRGLKIYTGPDHPHQAQQPEDLSLV
jgi:large subunit ribosomal protein L13